MTERASFSIEAMVTGHHAYKDIWTAVIGEELPCQRERQPSRPVRCVSAEGRSDRWPRP